MWLECPVEETDDRGRKTRTTEAWDNRRGIPQGSPISPLLANLYMRRFVLGWKTLGLEQRLGSRIVTYADDLVILCRSGKAEEALLRLREIMGRRRGGTYPLSHLYGHFGLVRLAARGRDQSWVKA